MRDSGKTKKQLIEELSDLRKRVADLEGGNGSKTDSCRHIEMRLSDFIELVPGIAGEIVGYHCHEIISLLSGGCQSVRCGSFHGEVEGGADWRYTAQP